MAYAGSSINKPEHFYLVSVNYNKADAHLRGLCTFYMNDEFLARAQLHNECIPYFFALSTCNRTEMYAFAKNQAELIDFFCQCTKLDPALIKPYLIVKKGEKAIDFLFRVGAGLESQIIGDFEIIGQIKKWFEFLKKSGFLDGFLERLLNAVIQASKRIKSETKLSTGAASVAYAAVRYILKELPEVSAKNILLYGLGKIGRNVCKNLLKHTDHKHINLINRTYEKAHVLAASERLFVTPYEHLERALSQTDVLIVASSASARVILPSMLRNRTHGLLILDLSVPENVDPSVRKISGIRLLNIDALSQQADETIDQRKKEIPKAEIILNKVKEEFVQWYKMRKYAPVVQKFKDHLTKMYSREITQYAKKNPNCTIAHELATAQLIQKITNRFARHIFVHENKPDHTIALIRAMFDLKF